MNDEHYACTVYWFYTMHCSKNYPKFLFLFCRCNNVLYLRGVPEDEEIEDAERD